MWVLARWWRTLFVDRRPGSARTTEQPARLELTILTERASPTFLDASTIALGGQRAPVPKSATSTPPVVSVRSAALFPASGFEISLQPTRSTVDSRASAPNAWHPSAALVPVVVSLADENLSIPLQLNTTSSVTAAPVVVSGTWIVQESNSVDRSVTVASQQQVVSLTPAAFLPNNVAWVPQPVKPPLPNAVPSPSQPVIGTETTSTPVVDNTPKQPNAAVFYLSGLPGRDVQVNVSQHGASGSVTVASNARVPESGQLSVPISTQKLPMQTPAEVVTITVRDDRELVGQATQFLKPVSTIGDVALFQAYRVGESNTAFQHLVKRYETFVQRVGERVLNHQVEAQDVGQQVFLELSRFRGEFAGTMAAWLRTVTKNTAISFLRASRRRSVRERSVALTEAGQAPSWDLMELTEAIDKLPADVGEAVRLRYLEGYSQQEAADLVGCPRGTLARRASDGVRALRGLL